MHFQNGIDAFYLKCPSISEIRSLSADCLPSLLGASACGVSASQLFGRSVANFFNPIRITGKSMKDKLILNMLRDETNSQFFFEKIVDWSHPELCLKLVYPLSFFL